MTDEETMAAFIAKAAETGYVIVARDVWKSLLRLPRPKHGSPLAGIEISVSDHLEPGVMVAVQKPAAIPAFDLLGES